MEFAHNKTKTENSALIGESRAPPWPKKNGESLSRQVYWASWQLCSWGPNSTPGTNINIPTWNWLGFQIWEICRVYITPHGCFGKLTYPPSSLVLLSGGDFPAFTFGGTCFGLCQFPGIGYFPEIHSSFRLVGSCRMIRASQKIFNHGRREELATKFILTD